MEQFEKQYLDYCNEFFAAGWVTRDGTAVKPEAMNDAHLLAVIRRLDEGEDEIVRKSDLYKQLVAEKEKRAVFAALDRAIANGYDELKNNTPAQIAVDLCTYDSEFEDIDGDLTPHIRAWLDARRSHADGR